MLKGNPVHGSHSPYHDNFRQISSRCDTVADFIIAGHRREAHSGQRVGIGLSEERGNSQLSGYASTPIRARRTLKSIKISPEVVGRTAFSPGTIK